MLAWGRTVYMAMVGCRRIEERERERVMQIEEEWEIDFIYF